MKIKVKAGLIVYFPKVILDVVLTFIKCFLELQKNFFFAKFYKSNEYWQKKEIVFASKFIKRTFRFRIKTYFLNSKNFKYFFIDQIGAFSASLLVKRNNLCKRGRSKTTGEGG